MDKDIKVSIVIITYNRARFLPEAIESVLAQSFADWEMIVVDDASTDNTKEVVEKYCACDSRIKYYRNPENLNISKSRNRGMELAVGKYIAVLDSDDMWCDEEKIATQYSFLEEHPDHILVGGGVIVVDENGVEKKRYIDPQDDKDLRRIILSRNPFAQSTVMYNRKAVLDLGGYDNALNGIEDYDLWLRIGSVAKFANINRHVLKYRVHGGNISVTDRLRLVEHNLSLVKKNKNNFPSYYKAILRRQIRLFLYRIVSKIKR